MTESAEGSKFDLSIIIVTWNTKELAKRCLDHIRASKDTLNKQILLVDNGSNDGTAQLVKKNYSEVRLIESATNLGFTRGNNLAYKQVTGKYILMLNSDAFIEPTTLQTCVDFMEQTLDCGVLGARLRGEDGVLKPSARYFPTPLRFLLRDLGLDGKVPGVGALDAPQCDHSMVQECDWVVGCYLLTRKQIIDDLGYFLREDLFMYNDDNDLCLRIKRRGWKVIFYPTDVVHIGGATAKKVDRISSQRSQIEKYRIESQYIYFRKNYHVGTVISNFLYIALSDAIEMVKMLIGRRSKRALRDLAQHFALALQILWQTRFGSRSIH